MEPGLLGWTPFLEQLSIGLGAAVGGWLVVFMGTICCQSNEVFIARRQIAVTNVASLLMAVSCVGVLVLEVLVLRRFDWPHIGMALPILQLVLTALSACVNSHVCFRWVQLLVQPVGIVMTTLAAAQEDVQITCLEKGTCLITVGPAAGWSLQQLYQLRWFRIATCMAAVWIVLGSGLLLAALGCCWPRYTPRLFSSEHPLSSLPARRGREHRTAESQGMAVALRRAQQAKIPTASTRNQRRRHLGRGGSKKAHTAVPIASG